MCLLGPALPLPGLPPRWCCCTPRLGHAGCTAQVTLGLPVSSSVNPAALRALAQRGLELYLEHRQ